MALTSKEPRRIPSRVLLMNVMSTSVRRAKHEGAGARSSPVATTSAEPNVDDLWDEPDTVGSTAVGTRTETETETETGTGTGTGSGGDHHEPTDERPSEPGLTGDAQSVSGQFFASPAVNGDPVAVADNYNPHVHGPCRGRWLARAAGRSAGSAEALAACGDRRPGDGMPPCDSRGSTRAPTECSASRAGHARTFCCGRRGPCAPSVGLSSCGERSASRERCWYASCCRQRGRHRDARQLSRARCQLIGQCCGQCCDWGFSGAIPARTLGARAPDPSASSSRPWQGEACPRGGEGRYRRGPD